MGNFVTADVALPPDKVNGPIAVPVGQETMYGRAEDLNFLRDAAGDLRDHTRGWVNARSYGLACDGATNDYPALAAMLTLLGSTPATLIVPGPCLVGTSVTIPATLPVRFEGAGAFTGAGTVTFTPGGGVGPAGPAGPTGPQGPAGPQGVPGTSASSINSLFTTAPRESKLWMMPDNSGAFIGVGANTPTVYGAGSRTFANGVDRFWLQFTLTATVNASAGYWWGGVSAWSRAVQLPKLATRCRINQLTNTTVSASLCGASGGSQHGSGGYVPTLGGSNADTASFVEIGYDSRVSPNWIIGSGTGVTASWTDSGMLATVSDDFLLIIEFLTPTSAKLTITDCTSGASVTVTKSSNMPSPTAILGPNIGAANFAAEAKIGPYFEYVYMEHN